MTFYVVTSAKHSAEVYRNTNTLSFENFVQGLMRTNGNTDRVIRVMYAALPNNKPGFPNPQGDSLGVLAQKMHIHQLHPGENLVSLQKAVQVWISGNVTMRALQETCSFAKSKTPSSIEMPVYQWCSNYFVRLGQHVYFGQTLDDIGPTLTDDFFVFDELIWKMLYQYPSFLSHDMSRPRTRIIASLKQYFQAPRRNGEMRALGIDDEDLAVLVFHLYFAINTNTRKTVFWLLTYLLHNPSYLEAYRQETGPAFQGHDLVDPHYIQDPAKCPLVDAVWNETLRLSGWSASVRLVTRDTVIGGKRLRAGHRVMVPHRLLHFDEAVFGADIHAFWPERWMAKGDGEHPPANLTRSPSWRPFGAGKTMCSGRFLARFSVTTLVATLLRRFNVELVGSPKFPRADEGRPVLGIMSIKEGDDFTVRLTPMESVSN
ncbi:hypothetical protein PG997_012884 [Apiospora hydei]|uniref:Cytochrome P450 n=1 Tax=Apiospora hydei TaxID=1337664 RepID=A0ABR1V4L9_9PEZI